MDIDFVVTWVDGNDPKWFAEYSKYNPNQISDANHKSRFRDWGTFRYLFRAFDKFTPWVNKIHLVTMDQKPEWLNTKADKLNLVSHRDIFLDDSYLPTFNSYAIEANINHIKELSKYFVLFNDDQLILKPVKTDEFFVNNLPRDFLIQRPFKSIIAKHLFPNNTWIQTVSYAMKLVNQQYDKHQSIQKYRDLYYNNVYGIRGNLLNRVSNLFYRFFDFEHYHHPQPYLKDVLDEVDAIYQNDMERTRSHKFRQPDDLIHYISRYTQLVTGRFVPQYNQNFKTVNIQSIKDAEAFIKLLKIYKHVCINDSPNLSDENFQIASSLVTKRLDELLPEKSSFEI